MTTAAVDRFREALDRAPEGAWAAPGRVNLIGEHTDYNDGFVLPFALPHRTTVAAARRDDDRVTVRSLQEAAEVVEASPADLVPGRDGGWAAYALGVVWALREAGHGVGGVDLVVDGQVPVGAGLSSSAALECSVAAGVADLHGLGLPPHELARVAQRAENDYVGVPCGLMDQMASMCCTEGHALFFDTRTAGTRAVPLDPEAAGLALLVVDTQVKHSLADGEYGKRRSACEEAAATLGVAALRDVEVPDLPGALERLPDPVVRRRVRHVVTENARVLDTVAALDAGDWSTVGRLMVGSHNSLRDLYEVSSVELDLVVEVALTEGGLGARMTGGGFGGSAVALVPRDRVDAVVGGVEAAFDRAGHQPPRAFVVTPSAGATRVV